MQPSVRHAASDSLGPSSQPNRPGRPPPSLRRYPAFVDIIHSHLSSSPHSHPTQPIRPVEPAQAHTDRTPERPRPVHPPNRDPRPRPRTQPQPTPQLRPLPAPCTPASPRLASQPSTTPVPVTPDLPRTNDTQHRRPCVRVLLPCPPLLHLVSPLLRLPSFLPSVPSLRTALPSALAPTDRPTDRLPACLLCFACAILAWRRPQPEPATLRPRLRHRPPDCDCVFLACV